MATGVVTFQADLSDRQEGRITVRPYLLASAAILAGFAALPMAPALAQAPAPSAPAQAQTPAPAPSTIPAPGATPSPQIPLRDAPTSFAPLARQLLPAVVNVQTTTTLQARGPNRPDAPEIPQAPPGSPFEEFFRDFLERNRPGGPGGRPNQPQAPRRAQSLGSGFIVDAKEGIVVTNNHVIDGADEINVVLQDNTTIKAELLGTDQRTDIAVLKIKTDHPLSQVDFGDSDTAQVGDWVLAIGNPFGLGGSVTAGIVSARGRDIRQGLYDDFIQTDAAINRGNSGGPLFNMKGEVIGINTAIISPSGGSIGIGFAVPTELAANVVKQLSEFGETRRGWLGVRIQPVTDEVAKSLNLEKAGGALIAGVIEGGPIKNGELKSGDVIVSFNGKKVNDTRDLQRIVAESPIGEPVDAKVLRAGKEETVKITLGRLEDQDGTKESKVENDPTARGEVKPAPDDDSGDDAASAESVTILGLTATFLDDDSRKTYKVSESVEGVVITAIEPGSAADKAGLKVGEVIVEIGQEFMAAPSDVTDRITALKQDGRRSAHMMVAKPDGDLRFVGVPVE